MWLTSIGKILWNSSRRGSSLRCVKNIRREKKKSGCDRFTVENLLIITLLEIRLRRIRQPDILFDWNQARINSWKKKAIIRWIKTFFWNRRLIEKEVKHKQLNKNKNISNVAITQLYQDSRFSKFHAVRRRLLRYFQQRIIRGLPPPFPVLFFFSFFFTIHRFDAPVSILFFNQRQSAK